MADQNSPTDKNPYSGFFQRLTRLFRSGTTIRRKVKGYDYRNQFDRQVSLANQGWRGGTTPFGQHAVGYNALGQYGQADRFARYQEFIEAESVPEVASALTVLSHETCACDENGKSFHVYTDNPEVRKALDELFNDVCNIEYNLHFWVRNMLKYGDMWIYHEVMPDYGVINVMPLPPVQVEREEGYDKKDPYAVRFRWQGGSSRYLENWQVSHFRMLGNDQFYPYGSSLLDPARRIIRSLIMAEDAMLTYRIARAPERLVFYIDTAGIPPNDVPSYMGRAQAALKSNIVVDKQTGRLDYRNNPMSILDNFYIPTRGSNFTTKVESIAGGQNVSAVEDVEYLQNKLFSALQVPKSYLNFGEDLSSKATLSLLDVRVSRTISVIQKVIIGELNKLAMIHLYAKGFDGEDLVDFDLRLSNPSTIAMQQKLELWAAKMNIAGTAKEVGAVDEEWIQKNILGLTNDEIAKMLNGRRRDKAFAAELESITPPQTPPDAPDPSRADLFAQGAYEVPGAGIPKAEPTESEVPAGSVSQEPHKPLWQSVSDLATNPVKPSGFMKRYNKNTSRHRGYKGAYAQANPDHSAMLSPGRMNTSWDTGVTKMGRTVGEGVNPSLEELAGGEAQDNLPTLAEIRELLQPVKAKMTREIRSMFEGFDQKTGGSTSKKKTLSEAEEVVVLDTDLIQVLDEGVVALTPEERVERDLSAILEKKDDEDPWT